MTELWSTEEIVRWLVSSLAVHERTARRLFSREDAPRPILIAGRKRYKRAEVERWLVNLPSIFGNETITGTKNDPTDQDR